MSRYWGGRVTGALSAISQITTATTDRIRDRIATVITKRNLRSAGSGCVIQNGLILRFPGQVSIGNRVRIGRNVEIVSEDPHSTLAIGDDTYIGRSSHIDFTGGLVIGSGTTLSEGVMIHSHDHGLDPRSKPVGKPVEIGDNVWIGVRAIVLQNVRRIGNKCVVAAGSIVTHEIPERSVYGGNPARLIRDLKDDRLE